MSSSGTRRARVRGLAAVSSSLRPSGFAAGGDEAHVLERGDVDPDVCAGEQIGGQGFEPRRVSPAAVASQLVIDEPPHSLDHIDVGLVDR